MVLVHKPLFALFGLIAVLTFSAIDTKAEKGFISLDDTRLFYEKVGSGRDVVVVPLHLFMFEDFKHLAKGKTFIFYDVRNRGRSDAVTDLSKVTIQQDVDDLEMLRRHFGIERMSLIGESYAGLMVVMYAMKYPQHVSRMVQIGSVPLKFGTQYPKEYTANDPKPIPDASETERLQALIKQGYHLTNPQDFCVQDFLVNRHRRVGDPANVSKVRSVCHLSNEWPVNLLKHFGAHFVSVQKLDIPNSDVARVTVPVLTIHGTRDRNVAYGAGREWATLLPNSRLLTIKDAAHFPWLDEPRLVFDSIGTFLSGSFPRQAEMLRNADQR